MLRRDCQYCRYQKCLSCGMRPSWVLSDSERDRRFNKRRKLFGDTDSSSSGSNSSSNSRSSNSNSSSSNSSNSNTAELTTKKKKKPKEAPVSVAVPLISQPVLDMAIEDWSAIEKVHNYVKSVHHNDNGNQNTQNNIMYCTSLLVKQ